MHKRLCLQPNVELNKGLTQLKPLHDVFFPLNCVPIINLNLFLQMVRRLVFTIHNQL
jgi:hypothetical protein